MKKVVLLIPALDPPAVFPEYVRELLEAGFGDILVVNDGSSSEEYFDQIRDMGCVVLKHTVNEGKGQALKTGLSYYQEHYDHKEYAGVITADSDGQHLCRDVRRLAEKLVGGEQRLILGTRDFSLPQVPPKSRFGNNLTSWIFRYLLRLQVSDTQTGLRGIPNVLIEPCLHLPGKRFEYETTMLTDVGKAAGICEIPIETVYYEENKGTHFNPVVDSFRIYRMIFGTFFRYIFSSLSSSVLDLLLFALFSKVLLAGISWRIAAATGMARAVSSVYNFCMNRNLVFKSDAGYFSSAVRYFGLCIVQAAASALLVTGGCHLLGTDEVLVKLIVDTALFFVSYQIQKRLIFIGDRKNDGYQK